MTRLTLAGLVAVALMGCDMVNTPEQVTDAYRDYLPESASNRYACTKYVQWPDSVIEVDSASYCPFSDSGAYYPILVRTTWTGIGGCGVVGNGGPAEERLVGGIKGIKRDFGCYRKPIAHPVTPKVECVDCNHEKL